MTDADLRSALSSKWDQVVARTQAAGDLLANPGGAAEVSKLRELAMFIKEDADNLQGQYPDLTHRQRRVLSAFEEAVRIRCGALLQAATGAETRDVTIIGMSKFLWEESASKARKAYAALG